MRWEVVQDTQFFKPRRNLNFFNTDKTQFLSPFLVTLHFCLLEINMKTSEPISLLCCQW